MKITRRSIAWWSATAVTVALIAYAVRPKPVEVEWATVSRGPLRVVIEAEALARSRSRYVVTAPVSGRVERIALTAGDSVKQGTVLARIASAPLEPLAAQLADARLAAAEAAEHEAQARLLQARTLAEQAAREAQRVTSMQAAGGVSDQQREAAQAAASSSANELKAAESRAAAVTAEVSAARLAVEANRATSPIYEVRSPARAHVLRVPEISERVTLAGSPLMELGDPRNLEVVADLLSTDAVRIPPGAPVDLAEWGGSGELPARVRLVEPVATTRVSALGVEEQRVNVVIDPLAPAPGLGDGYRLTARVVLWSGTNVITVPSSAVFSDAGSWSVFVVDDNRAALRRVSVGHRSDAAVEVLAGLDVGETVVLFPSDRVRAGARLALR